ncbi:Cytochrome b-c1 complex subunit 8, mitochondrial [Elasticomyces elasticus]|nr:Cytochrome b-c1 complex subunit 8, mitochondrial [Elasticomyces elasticus]
MGGGGEKKPGQYMGSWGNLGSPPQKGVTTYGLSQNRQKPLAGVTNAAIFNTWRRTRAQILYWGPAMLIAYSLMGWATEKNDYLNSKPGRAEFAGQE